MAWNQVKTSNVLDEFTPSEKAVLQNIQGSTAGLGNVLARVTSKVRGQIKAGGNQLDQSSQTSIPDQLVEEVIAITRWKWLSGFPALKILKTDDRKNAASEAEITLKDIASNSPNRARVELPESPDTTQSPVNGVTIVRPGRHIRTNSFDKLGET